MQRMSKPEYSMSMAFTAALRATCIRAKVGAVIVDDHGRILGTGFNGTVTGDPECLGHEVCNKDGLGCITTIHAERNAIESVDRLSRYGSTLYVTMSPCLECFKAACNAGISKIVYFDDYRKQDYKQHYSYLIGQIKVEKLESNHPQLLAIRSILVGEK